MKTDCPSFRLYIDNHKHGDYSTRADVYNAIRTLGVYGRTEWRESNGRNKDWCERNDIEKLLDDCYIFSEK